MEDGRELELVEGTVASLIFQNEENGYTILRLERGGEELTVVGSMPGVSPGEYLSVQGRWVRHATYGAQFKAEIGGAPPAPEPEGGLPLPGLRRSEGGGQSHRPAAWWRSSERTPSG